MKSLDFKDLRVIVEERTMGGTITRLMRDQISPRSTHVPSMCVYICGPPTRMFQKHAISHGKGFEFFK